MVAKRQVDFPDSWLPAPGQQPAKKAKTGKKPQAIQKKHATVTAVIVDASQVRPNGPAKVPSQIRSFRGVSAKQCLDQI